MSIRAEVRGLDGLGELFGRIRRGILNRSSFDELTGSGIDAILKRTSSGKDLKGSRFKPYSGRYARFRVKRGKGAGVGLKFSGEMLGSISARAHPDEAQGVIFIEGDENILKALANESGEGKGTARKFFGITGQEADELRKVMERRVKRVIQDNV